MTRINEFGWRGSDESGVARVVSAHGDYYHLVCNECAGEIIARKKKSVFAGKSTKAQLKSRRRGLETCERGDDDAAARPMTGDFVRFRYNDRGDSLILEVLPRFSHFERKDPTARRKAQTLAVNFDTLFVMMSLNENFSVPRIERFLTLAEGMGEAEAVVVLTKCDLVEPGDEEVANALASLRESEVVVRAGCRILEISCVSGAGLDEVREYAAPGRTLAFVGSSGVGKSTLLNTLAGEEWAATAEIQEWSGKGRHTTTSRELVMLPSGAMVIDTPGVREIGFVGEVDAALVKGASTHRWRL